MILKDGKPKFTNRLINERSPYLVQHAHNPVDWFPWGDEAFELAKQQNKPVFLSIGYSTCHWCHVMERESFDDEEVAAFLNQHFISIKLDREERPDLDEIYMTGLQLLSGQGGWPMSNFITAQGQPFYAGTYYPKANFLTVLEQLHQAWETRHEEVIQQAQQVTENIERQTAVMNVAQSIDENLGLKTALGLLDRLDQVHGGFGSAPKFPNESQLWLFLSVLEYQAQPDLAQALKLTLNKMYQGGLCDQLGGGFHRYSVDQKWLVPHFEKMLYNQAQLLKVYGAGYQLTLDPAYLRVAKRTIDYLLREMTAEDGRFFSASDADTEGEEGRFFVWNMDELQAVLTDAEFALVQRVFNVTETGNFEGANILHLSDSLEATARTLKMNSKEFEEDIDGLVNKLLSIRAHREAPFVDRKHIVSWNGLLISALIDVELRTGVKDYRWVALNAAESIWQHQYDSQSDTLWRVGMEHQLSIKASLEDYAYLSEAFLQLYLVSEDSVWLERAATLLDGMQQYFWDEEGGGYFNTLDDTAGPMITRTKSSSDGAIASGNAMAMLAHIRYADATGDEQHRRWASTLVATFSSAIASQPAAHGFMLSAVQLYQQGSRCKIQFAAGGAIRIEASLASNTVKSEKCLLRFSCRDGWHINHPEAQKQGLMTLKLPGAQVVEYPKPILLDAAFDETPISVMPDEFTLEVTRHASQATLTLELQACSNEVCLAPETLNLNIPSIADPR